jgi:hypothetical protein
VGGETKRGSGTQDKWSLSISFVTMKIMAKMLETVHILIFIFKTVKMGKNYIHTCQMPDRKIT